MATYLDVLRDQARALPEEPGVYFWKDMDDHILYIGKAKNLRARVTTYFSTARHDRRVRDLLRRSRSICYEVAESEPEALLRESVLIKREQPGFNRALRTSRQPYYLKLDLSRPDPYLETTRTTDQNGTMYFGPFRSGHVMRETLKYVHEVLPLRKCTALQPRCAPCLYHQMGTCAAPLLDEAHRKRHQQAISDLRDLLDGRSDKVRAWLEQKRDRLSEALLFELAAETQRRLDALDQLLERQLLLEAAITSRCVLIYQPAQQHIDPRLLLVAHGNVVSIRACDGVSAEQLMGWIHANEPVLRAAELGQSEVDAASVLQRWLTSNRERVRWIVVPRGASDADLSERLGYLLRQASGL